MAEEACAGWGLGAADASDPVFLLIVADHSRDLAEDLAKEFAGHAKELHQFWMLGLDLLEQVFLLQNIFKQQRGG
ncbi:hypothetical protein PtA15_15A25 [Puccinia triticina]|uniref:Uncharacterized protein n=1 Tax=Puccinia triticina TaxID=208348 RepID=A0ABY7D2K1_9BASI|nr:uncharacterized protein PtA15_15A25 [Puccinia triticina]WAQ91636.1 hypothetical protein PtA15_15A25 [Puccinia triticina]WAR62435.1 hypothetical protein PtB15_15B19 [Puccinia triticina]